MEEWTGGKERREWKGGRDGCRGQRDRGWMRREEDKERKRKGIGGREKGRRECAALWCRHTLTYCPTSMQNRHEGRREGGRNGQGDRV